ncbi:sorting nexin-14 [Plakobranchus ocellatus]|uniref:Sorting nexin-14 n=1 Tax=Plakobranchus ocellatus TaxID=259542 RepID=A0AAV4BI11_9GAST|nr:sorting nexin-14 [Plakobranchus ocellatus]
MIEMRKKTNMLKRYEEKLANSLEAGLDGILLNSMPAPVSMEEDLEDDPHCGQESGDCSLHDLSSWRVTIPRIGARPDPDNPRKQYFVFIIDVRRVDVREGDTQKWQWTVARRYPEFYALEQKLTEFHGIFNDCQLPAKKSFGTKNQDFTEGKKPDFENYLQKLLTKPQLRNSELLYMFLTSEHEFSTSFLPDIKLGKFVKSKLVKEKGQHLDEFLVNFSTSTEAAKPRPSKLPRRGSEASLMSTSSEKLAGTHFENNMNLPFHPPPGKNETPMDLLEIDGVFDSFLYLAKQIYEAPTWLYQLILSARILFKETIEVYVEHYLEFKIDQVTQEHRLVSLVHLLRDVLFFDDEPPRSDDAKRKRHEQTLEELIEFLPGPVTSALGENCTRRSSEFLLNIFQQPKLNKQLTYVLLDILILELFPELTQPPTSRPDRSGEEVDVSGVQSSSGWLYSPGESKMLRLVMSSSFSCMFDSHARHPTA